MQTHKPSFHIALIVLTVSAVFKAHTQGGAVASASNAVAKENFASAPKRTVQTQYPAPISKEAATIKIRGAFEKHYPRFFAARPAHFQKLVTIACKEKSVLDAFGTKNIQNIDAALDKLVANGETYLLSNNDLVTEKDIIIIKLFVKEERTKKKDKEAGKTNQVSVEPPVKDTPKLVPTFAAAAAAAVKNKNDARETVAQSITQQADGAVPAKAATTVIADAQLEDSSIKKDGQKDAAKPSSDDSSASQTEAAPKPTERKIAAQKESWQTAPLAPIPNHHKNRKSKVPATATQALRPTEPSNALGSGSSSSSSAGSSAGTSPVTSEHNSDGETKSAEGSPTAKAKEAATGHPDSAAAEGVNKEEATKPDQVDTALPVNNALKSNRNSRDSDNGDDPYRTKFFNSVKKFVKIAGPTVALLIGANWLRNAINNTRKGTPAA